MTRSSISELLTELFAKGIKDGRLVALLLIGMVASVMPAHAQSNDAWKSVAIIGGSTAAGAYVGHKIGGSTGAYIGAAVGASAGYAIDRRRRQNEGYNSDYSYGNGGYGDNGGYYGNNDPNTGDGGYYGGSGNSYPNSRYPNSSNYVNDNRQVYRRR